MSKIQYNQKIYYTFLKTEYIEREKQHQNIYIYCEQIKENGFMNFLSNQSSFDRF